MNKKLLDISIKVLDFLRMPRMFISVIIRCLIITTTFLLMEEMGIKIGKLLSILGMYWVLLPMINTCYFWFRDYRFNEFNKEILEKKK